MFSSFLKNFFCFVAPLLWIHQSLAAEVSVAVAANFAAPMKIIAQHFERTTGYKAVLSFGGTGQFYAQIKNGAPFAVLLAADTLTPAKIEKEGLGVPGTTFTYAIGQLVLWSKKPGLVDDQGEILKTGNFSKIAIANPKLAPYGSAAIEVLNHLGIMSQVKPKIVEGSNIAQAYQFVFSENASLGFVAMSQVYEDGKLKQGSDWIVPAKIYSPIKQDAILLNSGRNNPAAIALMTYLQSEAAKAVMHKFGYQ
jgi:molybdate transport system substrate-binding protein